MVQFYGTSRPQSSYVIEALGQGAEGLGRVAGEQFRFQQQRGRLQKALGELQKLTPDQQKNPAQLLTSLLSATAGIPGAEKYVGQVFPYLLAQQSQGAKSGFQMEQPGGGPEPMQPQGGQPIPQGKAPPQGKGAGQAPVATQDQQTKAPLNVFDLEQPSGTFPGQISDPNLQNVVLPKIYTPEQIQNIRMRARAQGLLPDIEDALVNQAEEYNQNSRKQIADLQSGYALQNQLRKDTLENQRAFTEYVEKEAPEFASPDEKQLALELSEKYQNEPSFAKRLARVKNEMRPYQQAKAALNRTLDRPLFGMNENQLSLARKNAQMMVDMGQKDQLRLMIAAGGHGDVEEALLLNPLPEAINKDLASIPRFIKPEEKITVPFDSPKYDEQLKKATEHKQKQMASTQLYLQDAIKPGTYANPGTNLLLVRKNLMEKGLSWDDAGLMIQNAVGNGKIKLDPHQQVDMQKLGYPPLGGEAYTDNLIQYYLFGKE